MSDDDAEYDSDEYEPPDWMDEMPSGIESDEWDWFDDVGDMDDWIDFGDEYELTIEYKED